jgi:hypothetical protein
MSATEEPLGVGWEAFFDTYALPREEEAAFRAYLRANEVPDEAGVQELTAHHAEFRRQWAPGSPDA